MENRATYLSSGAKKLKACGKKDLSKDWISELPDETIVYVLSLLTMKEAGRTSVLSKRWRYVWAYIPVLNFDSSNILHKLQSRDTSLEVEKPRYLRWVNQVVGSYKGPTIDEFRLQFDLDMTDSYNIDNWVQFVMDKKVKSLQLDFSNRRTKDGCYTFPDLPICNSLTFLQLVNVDVMGDVLQNFLKTCTGLEFLSVKFSKLLVNLKVVGATLNLKPLEVCHCFGIKHIEICAPNLVSFKYFGRVIDNPFKRTPKLAKLSMGGDYCQYLTNNFSEFSSCLIRLEALALVLRYKSIKKAMKSVDQFPLCTRLQQLEIFVSPDDDDDLFCFAPLIKACPFLHKLVLKLDFDEPDLKRKRRKREACPHYHLKIVEIVGFLGYTIDVEFLLYLMESCVALEKIAIDPRDSILLGTPWEFKRKKETRRARKQAQKLRTKLKPGVDLIIL